jgi:hypothetical protein
VKRNTMWPPDKVSSIRWFFIYILYNWSVYSTDCFLLQHPAWLDCGWSRCDVDQISCPSRASPNSDWLG